VKPLALYAVTRNKVQAAQQVFEPG